MGDDSIFVCIGTSGQAPPAPPTLPAPNQSSLNGAQLLPEGWAAAIEKQMSLEKASSQLSQPAQQQQVSDAIGPLLVQPKLLDTCCRKYPSQVIVSRSIKQHPVWLSEKVHWPLYSICYPVGAPY